MAGPLWCCVGPLLPPDSILSATGAAGTSYKRHWLLLPGLMDLSSLDLSIFFPPRKRGWGLPPQNRVSVQHSVPSRLVFLRHHGDDNLWINAAQATDIMGLPGVGREFWGLRINTARPEVTILGPGTRSLCNHV